MKALITGGAIRVGRAITLALAHDGFEVGIHAFQSSDAARDLVQHIEKSGGKARTFCADFRDPSSVSAFATEVLSWAPTLDVLVHNASSWPQPHKVRADLDFQMETLALWDEAIAVNARAPFFLTQQLFGAIAASKNSTIFAILDSSAFAPFRDRASHSVSKAALLSVGKCIAQALTADTRVYALELGSVLANEKMTASERESKTWLGTDIVSRAISHLVAERPESGIYEVSSDTELRWKDSFLAR